MQLGLVRAGVIDEFGVNERVAADPETMVRELRVQPGLDALDEAGHRVRVEIMDDGGAWVAGVDGRRRVGAGSLRPVRPEDRRNVGTVTGVDDDGLVQVRFVNRETGNSVVKPFQQNQLEVVRLPKQKQTPRSKPVQRRQPSQSRGPQLWRGPGLG